MPQPTDAVIPITHATFAMVVVALLAWCLRGAAEHRTHRND
ncbi:hypothetical protein XccvBFoX4_gp85 [Xanthomonas phage FoX4]|uniref:Uncharacterized protein n=1 Tax=Xanthomonas phage FoX4 TaxID=2723900 RepID=A0A858WJB9_9CAUD|nr:hypothetical protein KNU97_gp85 [Xanthomonas phage FoX4]QJI53039.1 hypothetical protein XccvBFoX4_gp85 [Xanthomonas phage FoX4]